MKLPFIVKNITSDADLEISHRLKDYRYGMSKKSKSGEVVYIVNSYYDNYVTIIVDKRKLNKFMKKYDLTLTTSKILHSGWNTGLASCKKDRDTLGTGFHIFMKYNKIL